jgi:hypothetical protein
MEKHLNSEVNWTLLHHELRSFPSFGRRWVSHVMLIKWVPDLWKKVGISGDANKMGSRPLEGGGYLR